jgi:hypothetical protein
MAEVSIGDRPARPWKRACWRRGENGFGLTGESCPSAEPLPGITAGRLVTAQPTVPGFGWTVLVFVAGDYMRAGRCRRLMAGVGFLIVAAPRRPGGLQR